LISHYLFSDSFQHSFVGREIGSFAKLGLWGRFVRLAKIIF